MVEKLFQKKVGTSHRNATKRDESEKKIMPAVDVTTTVWGMEYSVHGACAIATVQTD